MTPISAAAPRPNDATMQQLRRAEIHEHPAAPAGLESHGNGLRHEVQRGDSAYAIAREYSQAYHMDVTAKSLEQANPTAFQNGLQPGELLEIPNLQARFDTMIGAGGPGAQYVTKRGDTLASIARQHTANTGTKVTWQDVYETNRATIGSDPHKIRPGQVLTMPGGSTQASPLQTLSDLDQDVVLTRVGRVMHERGGVSSIDVVRFRGDGSHAEQHSSLDQAIGSARSALAGNTARSNPIAVVQTRDGAYHTMPVRGVEVSQDLDDSDRTLSLGWRAGEREVVAVVEKPHDRPVEVRRFDR